MVGKRRQGVGGGGGEESGRRVKSYNERRTLSLVLNVLNVLEDWTLVGRSFHKIIARGKKLSKVADFFVRGTG